MVKILQWLFFGHIHEWEVIQILNRTGQTPSSIGGKIYVLQCKKCGNIKQKDIG